MAFKTLPNLAPILQARLIYLWSHPPQHKLVPPHTSPPNDSSQLTVSLTACVTPPALGQILPSSNTTTSSLNAIPCSFCLAQFHLYGKGPRWYIAFSLKAFSTVSQSDKTRPSFWVHTLGVHLCDPHSHIPLWSFMGSPAMTAGTLNHSFPNLQS